MRKIVLASSSPRRKKLLEQIGLQFEVCASNFDEKEEPGLTPQEQAIYLSRGKVKDIAPKYEDAIIIAADTFVSFNNEVLSKPETKENAERVLKMLSGKSHPVITGFTIFDTKSGKMVSKSVETKVFMKKLTHEEIDVYINTGEPLDKAGGYGIQERGAIFIEKIDGDYNNVVGIPLFALASELKEFGINFIEK